MRDIVREAFTRLFLAENTLCYSRASGTLFVVVNAKQAHEHVSVSSVLSRLGRVRYLNQSAGEYEVQYDAEKSNMVNSVPPEVLGMPGHTSYVAGNITELLCLDTMRVRAAAARLRDANVGVLRMDIRDALLQVLKEPWSTDQETYSTLLEALVTYAPEGDQEMVKVAQDYFQYCCEMGLSISPMVIQKLILECPDYMADPVVTLWSSNPLVWDAMLSTLGARAEDQVLQVLANAKDHQLINACLKFLENYGSRKSASAVEALVHHDDSLISRSARATLAAIKSR